MENKEHTEHEYTIIVEPTDTGYSAYVLDLPGCITTGPTLAAIRANMREAISLHLEGMREDGVAIPLPHSQALVLTA